jgi:hypothetical protein
MKRQAEHIEFSAPHLFAYGRLCNDVMHKTASSPSPLHDDHHLFAYS